MTTVGAEPQCLHNPNAPPFTDDDIIRLAQKQCQTGGSPPPFLLSPDSHQSLISYLHARSTSSSPSSAVSEYAVSLLSLIPPSPHSPSISSLLSSILLAYIDLYNTRKIPHDSNSLKTIQLFALNIQNVLDRDLPSISELIISNLARVVEPDDAQLLKLLPRCLELISKSKEIEEGEEYLNSALDRILMCNWSKVLLVNMVSLIREFSFMDKNRRREFLEKVFDGMKSVDLQDIPSLAYQLLVAASKGFSKREVIEGIVMSLGSKMGSKVTSTMRQVEGTVLLHVNFAVKQDPSLGQEVLALLKSDLTALNHFTMAVLLSVSRVRRFNESCMRVMKMAVLSAYRDYKLARTCKWLPEDLKEKYLQQAKMVEKTVLRAVNDSNYGREHVVPSIVEFGFLLLKSVDEANSKGLEDSHHLMGLDILGMEILKTLFKIHDMSRTEIIEQCRFHILSPSPEQSKTIVRFVGLLVLNFPYPMLEHVSRLKELLDYFTFMHSTISTCLITALLPLTKFSRDLQDYIILVVRKAMFNREDTVRVAAINAVIELILADKQPKYDGLFSFQESSSQASCSQQQDEILPGNNAGLFPELCGLLQRCLYQQAKVKEIMYHGLVKLVLVDPLVAGPIFEFLLPHSLRFFQEDSGVGLNISSCLKLVNGKICVDEPLDCLLSCISRILLLQPRDRNGNAAEKWACFGFSLSQENEAGKAISADSFSCSLQKIRKLLRHRKMEDIFGEVRDTSSESVGEQKQQYCAFIMSGIIQVVLNNVAAELKMSSDAKKVDLEREIVDLVNLYESLHKGICTSKQGHGIRRGNSKAIASDLVLHDIGSGHVKLTHDYRFFLGVSSIHQLLLTAMNLHSCNCSNDATASQGHSHCSQSNLLLSSTKLMSFILNACLRQMKSSLLMDRSDPTRNLIYGETMKLGAPILKLVLLLMPEPNLAGDQAKKEAKGRKDVEDRKDSIHLAIVCFRELINISLKGPEQNCVLEDCLSISTSVHAPEHVDSEDYEHHLVSGTEDQNGKSKMAFLQKVIKPLFSELLSASYFREVQILCDIVLIVGDKLPNERRSSIADWVISICKNSRIADAKVAKCLVMLGLTLKPPPDDLLVAEAMATQMLNSTTSDETCISGMSEFSDRYSIINPTTFAAAASSILQFIESVISDVQWATAKLKTCCIITKHTFSLDQAGEKSRGSVLEEIVYLRAEAVVKALSPFMGMCLKDPQAEQLLRLAARFYKQLAQMSKLCISPKGCKQFLPTLAFQKLVEITCRQLTVPLYNFVAQMQQNQLENERRKGVMNKIKRENRCIPDLIFQIEDYEKYLITLTKATKVNLLRHAKRSTARDFRILDPKKVAEKDAPAHGEAGGNNSSPGQNELCERSEDDEGNNSDNAESDGPVAAEASESDDEAEDLAPKAKRVKRNRVVEDSDEEV
ncbi:hypothetical protein Ancab_013595 [Ancistrocladus abbreviatus]